MDSFRRDLSGWLPERLDIAAANYRQFAATNPPEDTKAFAAHQAACRASLAHIQSLIGLARWVECARDPLSATGEDDLDRLYEEAETALGNQSFDES